MLQPKRLALLCTLFCAVATPAFAGDSYLLKFQPGVKNTRKLMLEAGVEVEREFREIEVYEITVTDRKLFKRARASMASLVKFITPNRKIRLEGVPNDEGFKNQDEMRRLQVLEAWKVTTGSRDVLVAVSDTGIRPHYDLVNRIWSNPAEIPGNGVDDDKNGYVDDHSGWDFKQNDNHADDQHGHGTHVAGIIGAEGNNRVGITGVNWDVRILPVKFLGADGSGTVAGGIASILYAHKMGAKIINCSWGSASYEPAIEEAVEYVFRNGSLVVAAAGNSGVSTDWKPHSPSALNSLGVISVGASTWPGRGAGFTNTGGFSVDVMAPGEEILSTLRTKDYARWSGTSMAAPMVAGVAALMLSLNPDLTPLQLRNGLLNGVRQYQDYSDFVATGGEMDAGRAVNQLSGGFQMWPARNRITNDMTYPMTIWNARGKVQWESSAPELATVDENGLVTPVAAAEGTLSIMATDETGARAAAVIDVIPNPKTQGCSSSSEDERWTLQEHASAAFSLFGLPLLAFGWIRRRRSGSGLTSSRGAE